MDVRRKRELITALRLRTDQLERAFALNDLNQVKEMEHLIAANLGELSLIVDAMERDR